MSVKQQIKIFLTSIFVFFITITPIFSQTTYTWGGGTSDWETGANWSPNGVPGAGDTVIVFSGQALLNSDISIGGMTLGGKLGGSGALTITGRATWQSGIMEGSGKTIIASGATLTIDGSGTKELITRSLENQGTITWKGSGDIRVKGVAPILNQAGAIFDIQNDEALDFILPDGGGSFDNHGTLQKSAGNSISTIDLLFTNHNSGTVLANSGILELERGSATASAGTFTASSGLLQFAERDFLLNNATFSGSGTVEVVDGTLIAQGAGFSVASGTKLLMDDSDAKLDGDGAITINGILEIVRGRIAGSGSFQNHGEMIFSGSNAKTLEARTIQNFAAANLSGTGTIRFAGGAIFQNESAGQFNQQTDANLDDQETGSQFINNGTFTKSAGGGTGLFDIYFTNNGIMNINSGSVELARGGGGTGSIFNIVAGSLLVFDDETFDLDGVAFDGSGTVEFSTISVNIINSGVTIRPGCTLTFPGGSVTGNGPLVIDGLFDWSRGAISGSGDFIVNGQLNITGSNFKELIERHLINNSIITWTDGDIKFKDFALLTNQAGAIFDIQTDKLIDYVLVNNGGTFINHGTLKKTAGLGTATIDPVFHNTGNVDITSGALRFERGSTTHSTTGDFHVDNGCTLVLSERPFTLDGVHFSGNGLTQITDASVNVTGSGIAMDNDATIRIDDSNALIEGDGPITIDGTLDWQRGMISGSGSFNINNTLLLDGDSFKELSGRTLVNNNNTFMLGAGSLRFSGNGTFQNKSGALFEIQTAAPLIYASTGGTFNNEGTFRKKLNSGQSAMDVNFNNTGIVEIEANASLDIGSTGRFAQISGSVSGAGDIFVDGEFDWQNGSISGSGVVNNGGLFEISGTTAKTLDTRNIVNTGTFLLNSNSDFALKNNVQVNNQPGGKMTVSGNGNINFVAPGGGSITNAGTFEHISNELLEVNVDVLNSGKVNAAAGTMKFNAAFDNLLYSELVGNGIIDVTAAAFSNNGIISPGASPGILTLNGNYLSADSTTLEVEVGGYAPGTEYDKLIVNGTANLANKLDIDLINLFNPVIGDTFRVLSYGARNGQFSDIRSPLLNGQPIFTAHYDANGMYLEVVAQLFPPDAADDMLSLDEDSDASINVLANDHDPDGTFISILSFGQGNHGVVTQLDDSSFHYQPAPNFFGADTFHYILRDVNNLRDTANVFVDVQPINDAPIVSGIPNISFSGGASLSLDLDLYVTDVDDDPAAISWFSSVLSASSVSNTALSLVDTSDLQISIDPASHLATFTTAANISGAFVVKFTAKDAGNLSDSDTMEVFVGGSPVVVNPIADVVYAEDSGPRIVVSDLDSVFTDPDGTPISFSASSDNPDIPVTLNGNSLILNMNANYHGSANITVMADDGLGNIIDDQFTATITPVNDAPIFSGLPGSIDFQTDSTVQLFLWDYVSDVETADSLLIFQFSATTDSIARVYNPSNGRLTLFTQGGYIGTAEIGIFAIDQGGLSSSDTLTVHVSPIVGITTNLPHGVPADYSLSQNYPNPFNPTTTIRFGLPERADVRIAVYNIAGQLVKRLASQAMDAGFHTITWDSRGENGQKVASGLYFYRIEAGRFVQTRKMILLQ